MRKLLLVLLLSLALGLSGCKEDESTYNFKARKTDYYISDNQDVIIDYKTDEFGRMIELNIDRLLTIEDMIYFNTQINYDYELEGFDGDIFTSAGFLCTQYDNFYVPINIEIGNTKFMYSRNECSYKEVDRDNIFKTGSYAREYPIDETIPVSKSIIISIVVYDVNSVEKFVEIGVLPHTRELLGVYSIPLNSDQNGFSYDGVYNYYYDMGIYEQIYLRNQENELTLDEIMGIPEEINIMDLDSMEDIEPLIDRFYDRYQAEIDAMDELEGEIGLFIDETEGETIDEEVDPSE